MNWTLIQIVIDIFLAVGMVVLWARLRRPPQDDPRLSRGLQLLQSKITVLEDLSDRTDVQVKQLTGLLDQKTRVIQDKIIEADRHNFQIHESMQKSLEVAEIFQDKIPHEDILERQKTIRYVTAAKMANSGASLEDIAGQVDLPREQLELIAKFNKEQLMFDEEALPEWAKHPGANNAAKLANFIEDEIPRPSMDTLNNLSAKFKESVKEFKENDEKLQKPHPAATFLKAEAHKTTDALRKAADGIGKRLADHASHLLENRHHSSQSPQHGQSASGSAQSTALRSDRHLIDEQMDQAYQTSAQASAPRTGHAMEIDPRYKRIQESDTISNDERRGPDQIQSTHAQAQRTSSSANMNAPSAPRAHHVTSNKATNANPEIKRIQFPKI